MLPGRFSRTLTIFAGTIIFSAVLGWWFIKDHYPSDVAMRVPGMDNRPKVEPRSDTIIIGEFFDSLGVFDEMVPGNWPRFRGVNFDNISSDSTQMAELWDTTGPPVVWKVTLGEGYSGPVVSNGRVYILDYNERRKADVLRCFSLKSGTELWRRWYYVDLKRNHGYSRTVPAMNDKYLVTLGPRSHVMCVEPITGDLLWSLDLEKEYGIPGTVKGKITPDFYTGQCPLIDNDVAILSPGGKAIMIGVDCKTGEVLWETPNPDSLRMSHTSIMPMVIHGKKMYVYNGIGGVCGISAEGEDTGTMLWRTTQWSPAVVAASPMLIGNNEVAVFGSYGAGGARLKINYDGIRFSAVVIETHKAMEGLSSDQQTPIMTGNYIWTVMPENAGPLKKQLVCYHRDDLRKPVWTSGKDNRYGRGLGPFILKEDRLMLLDDDANMFLFKLNNDKAEYLTKYKILDGFEAWGPMALAGNYLIMRDARNLVCLFIGKS